MTHEISTICDFLFGSIRTNLPMDTADVRTNCTDGKRDLHIQKGPYQRVQDIYSMEQKDDTFPFPEHKIQAYQDVKRSARVLPWNNGNTLQFSSPPMTQNNPRKAPGKIRARWSNKSRYIPMKTKRPNPQKQQ